MSSRGRVRNGNKARSYRKSATIDIVSPEAQLHAQSVGKVFTSSYSTNLPVGSGLIPRWSSGRYMEVRAFVSRQRLR